MSATHVMLVEDDDATAELLAKLVRSALPHIRVERHGEVDPAVASFSPARHRLLICDWNLPGKPGIELVRHVRQQEPRVPILMISGRHDRNSVISARLAGVDEYIVKPFRMEQVLGRLQHFLGGGEEAPPGDPIEYLRQLNEAALSLPSLDSAGQLGAQAFADDPPDLPQLAREWVKQPALVARLIGSANSSMYNPSGRLCGGLLEALQRLGWRTALNIASLHAQRSGGQLADPRLRQRADAQMTLAEKVAEQAVVIARECDVDPAPCQTAAMLHRIGELCVLLHMQKWKDQYGGIDEAEVDRALASCSAALAERLMQLWRYPTPLRELIGAIHELPPATVKREKFVLRLAGAAVYQPLDPAESEKMLRLAKG